MVSSFHQILCEKNHGPEADPWQTKADFRAQPFLFCLAMIALHRTGNGSPADLLCRPRSSPGQAAEKPFGGDPFPRPVSCRCVEGTDERRASIIMVYYTKACPPCQGNRKTESPCRPGADLVALPNPRTPVSPAETNDSKTGQRPAALLRRARGLPKAIPRCRANSLRPSKSNETGWRLPRAAGTQQKRHLPQQMSFLLEQVKGVEPSYQAWEACVLPMNYTCVETLLSIAHPRGKGKRKLCLCRISLERGFPSNKAETCNCRSLPLCHGKSVRV